MWLRGRIKDRKEMDLLCAESRARRNEKGRWTEQAKKEENGGGRKGVRERWG